MESIFLILSGVILAAGVLYWLWSHIQLTQKKVQLLENAVFELRSMLANSGERSGGASGGGSGSGVPAPVPSSPTKKIQLNAAASAMLAASGVVTEDDDDGWDETDAIGISSGSRVSVPLDTPVLEMHDMTVVERVDATVEDDLQPGGCAAPSAAAFAEVDDDNQSDNFRRLFAVQEVAEVSAPAPSPEAPKTISDTETAAAKTQESLESMPVKELRRLAEQRGIAGATDMRKKDILTALRRQVSTTVNLTLPEPGTEAGEVKEISIETVGSAAAEPYTAEILE